MDKLIDAIFADKTIRFPSFTLTKVDDTSLERFRTVINKVKEQTKSTAIKMDYDVMSKNLTITGTAVDLFYFGYYVKELE